MTKKCKSIGCNSDKEPTHDFCETCNKAQSLKDEIISLTTQLSVEYLAERYPTYYKPVEDITKLDVYAIHKLFDVQDASGCLQHASKKILLAGVRNGGKPAYQDIQEARDTLSRWLDLNRSTSL